MNHNFHIPGSPLNQFVDYIWVAKADSIKLESTHHAPLFTELIFNYADEFKVSGQNIDVESGNCTKRIISGLKTAPFTTTVCGGHATVGLILKPFCYGLLIRKFNTAEMDTLSEVLHDHLIRPFKPLYQVAEQHLAQLFASTTMDADLIKFEQYISAQMLRKGAIRNFTVALSITQKSFIQKFKRHYLLTPSQYTKLRQVHIARQLIDKTPRQKVVHAGLSAGFYDQAHFTKVFKQFCGQTPKQFQLQSVI